MDNQKLKSQHRQSNQENIDKLNKLAQQLQAKPKSPDELLRQYISIYIQCHHKTDQFFITLCENKFLNLLVGNSELIQQSTCILHCVNLLLVNTKLQQQLVYILSQSALHEYLFGLNIFKKDNEFIEYYVQLLKTILLKISEHDESRSLIRMFCNSKYPTFPIFTYVTLLAIDKNQLIRVTAQQCILILLQILNEKQIYQIYISQPPMLVLVVRLATQFLNQQSDHEGICKYFADLIYQLRDNQTPLLLICNTICNIIIVCSLPKKIYVALAFIEMLSKAIETKVLQQRGQQRKQKKPQFYKKGKNVKLSKKQEEQFDNLIFICGIFYRVLVKYLTNKYLNASYFSSMVNFFLLQYTEFNSESLPEKIVYPEPLSQMKTFQQYRFKNFKQQSYSSQVHLKGSFLEEVEKKLEDYGSTKDFDKLKQNYLKKNIKSKPNSSFFGRIFNRNSNQKLTFPYMKYVSDLAGLHLFKGQPVSNNIEKQLNPATSSFLSQYVLFMNNIKNGFKFNQLKTGQQIYAVEKDENHFNDIRSIWSFSPKDLQYIHELSSKFHEYINSEEKSHTVILLPKLNVLPSYLFLSQFKEYISYSIHEHLNRQPKNGELLQSNKMLKKLSSICRFLNVQLQQNAASCITGQLAYIHQHLQSALFENGFNEVIYYIRESNRQKFKSGYSKKSGSQIILEPLPMNKKKSSMKSKAKTSFVYCRLGIYECIQKIIEFNIKSLYQYFEEKWFQSFSKNKIIQANSVEQLMKQFSVCYFGKNGCKMAFIKIFQPPKIVLRIELHGKKLLQIDLYELEDIKKNATDFRVLQLCCGNGQSIKTQSKQTSQQVISAYNEYKFFYIQCATNSVVQYLSNTTEFINIKTKKQRKSSLRDSYSFQTPR